MLLNFLSNVLYVFARAVGRTTTDRADDERQCDKQQQNYSFNHNLFSE